MKKIKQKQKIGKHWYNIFKMVANIKCINKSKETSFYTSENKEKQILSIFLLKSS